MDNKALAEQYASSQFDGSDDSPTLDKWCVAYNAYLAALQTKAGEIIVFVEGGIATDVISDGPIVVHKVDYDTEGADESDYGSVEESPGKKLDAFVGEIHVDVNPRELDRFKNSFKS